MPVRFKFKLKSDIFTFLTSLHSFLFLFLNCVCVYFNVSVSECAHFFFFFFWNLLLVWKMLTELCRSRSNIISLKTWLILGDLAVSSVIFLIFCILFLNFHAFSRKSACDSCSINLCYKSCHNGGDEKVTKYLNVWKEKKHLITNQHGSFIRDENFLGNVEEGMVCSDLREQSFFYRSSVNLNPF